MPRAEKSLRKYQREAGGRLGTVETVSVLSDVAATHRRLGRPTGAPRHPAGERVAAWWSQVPDRLWHLPICGEDHCSGHPEVLDCTALRGTGAVAVRAGWYARGCRRLRGHGHELLSGSLPSAGPDFREQHLHTAPAPLAATPAGLAALVEDCLYKVPEARPSPANVLARLGRAADPAPSSGLAQLQQTNRANVARQGEISRQASVHQSQAERRRTLADSAVQALTREAGVSGTPS